MSRIKEILKQLSKRGWRVFNGIKSCFYALSIFSAVYDANMLLYKDVLTTCTTKECKPRNSEFHWSYFSRNDICFGMTTKLRNKKLQKYCSSARLMFANSPRIGKITIGVFFSHNSYSQGFFFHILSFFGVVAIFNSVFFRKFKDSLNYTISILISNRYKTLYRKWQYARRHEVLTSFLM